MDDHLITVMSLKLTNKTHQLISIISHKLTFKIGKGVRQSCILSSCLFNLYADYIIQNTGLDESQAGVKTAGKKINNLSKHLNETSYALRNLTNKRK